MRCNWGAFLRILPEWMREFTDRNSKDNLLELHLRLGDFPEFMTSNRTIYCEHTVSEDDLLFCINSASQYSPWAAETIAKGYITAPGGHRLGICGMTTTQSGRTLGISAPTSICIRVARDFPGIASPLRQMKGSVLIIGCPGTGKTTLLRDLVRQRSNYYQKTIGVVDEKYEIFPVSGNDSCFPKGKHTDVIYGCSKEQGIEMLLRNMGPSAIAVDEITAAADCHAMMQAGWCGVPLLATAHAYSKQDLMMRPIYAPIIHSGLFATLVILRQDKTWTVERINE